MKIKSGMTQRDIDFENNIIIVNPKQAAFYWVEKNINPVHFIPSRDKNTNEPIILFIFNKSETQEAYEEWKSRR